MMAPPLEEPVEIP